MKVQNINGLNFNAFNNQTEATKKSDTYYGFASGTGLALLSTGTYFSIKHFFNKKGRLNFHTPKSLVLAGLVKIACGAIIDQKINNERKNLAKQNNSNQDYKSEVGRKYGVLLGLALFGINSVINIFSAIKNKKSLASFEFVDIIDDFIFKTAGGAFMGWLTDSLTNKKLENPLPHKLAEKISRVYPTK